MFVLTVVAYVAVAAALLTIFRVVYWWLTPYNDREEIRSGNRAARDVRDDAYFGIVIALFMPLVAQGRWPTIDGWPTFSFDGLLIVVSLTPIFYVMDWFALYKINNALQIKAGNRAVAKVEGRVYIAQGLIFGAAFSGGGDSSWLAGVGSAALFTVLGQLLFAGAYWFEVCWYRMFDRVPVDAAQPDGAKKPRDIEREIADGNMRSATTVGCTLVAVGVVLCFSIIGEFTGWVQDILSFARAAGVGLSLLVLIKLVELALRRCGLRSSDWSVRLMGWGTVALSILIGYYFIM